VLGLLVFVTKRLLQSSRFLSVVELVVMLLDSPDVSNASKPQLIDGLAEIFTDIFADKNYPHTLAVLERFVNPSWRRRQLDFADSTSLISGYSGFCHIPRIRFVARWSNASADYPVPPGTQCD
jgi:hypothetical protein